MLHPLSIVVICNKNDYFQAKICVASIRYYYPNIDIYILKDEFRGKFSTWRLEKYLNVKKLRLKRKRFGNTGIKLFLLSDKKYSNQKFLILDSDTVFIGPVIDRFEKYIDNNDFLLSAEYQHKPSYPGFKKYYYDFEWAKKHFPQLKYPGYTFNTGQMVVTPGKFKLTDFLPYFKADKAPFWNKRFVDNFPTLDQSFLNIILPIAKNKKQITLQALSFMKWSEHPSLDKIKVNDVRHGKFKYIIHWAGSPKNLNVTKMTRGDILEMFQKYYYSKIPFGYFVYFVRNIVYKLAKS